MILQCLLPPGSSTTPQPRPSNSWLARALLLHARLTSEQRVAPAPLRASAWPSSAARAHWAILKICVDFFMVMAPPMRRPPPPPRSLSGSSACVSRLADSGARLPLLAGYRPPAAHHQRPSEEGQQQSKLRRSEASPMLAARLAAHSTLPPVLRSQLGQRHGRSTADAPTLTPLPSSRLAAAAAARARSSSSY